MEHAEHMHDGQHLRRQDSTGTAVMAVGRRLPVRSLVLPALAALLLSSSIGWAVAFDQGVLAQVASDAMRDSGGVLHELFHDARHLLGVPCH